MAGSTAFCATCEVTPSTPQPIAGEVVRAADRREAGAPPVEARLRIEVTGESAPVAVEHHRLAAPGARPLGGFEDGDHPAHRRRRDGKRLAEGQRDAEMAA